ncbi:MAG: serine/threonine protein kinase [Planctomycetes bacterium]|nr:serine/threonine protein kinase [Planctomycetota bacterium]
MDLAEESDDETSLDELFELAIRARASGAPLDVDGWLAGREYLRARANEAVAVALAVTPSAPPRSGVRSAQHFPGIQMLEEIGRGGSGVVYRAEQKALGRVVALKVLSPALAASAHARERFLREARALGRVRHPQVVAIYEVFASEELCAYAMEWIEGSTLAKRLAASVGPLEAREVAQLGAQIARALVAVHAAGLVHRDVKPSNLLLRADGSPVLGDFGLVRDEEQSAHTATGEFLGTAAYAAPEQLRGEHVAIGPWSDAYSLGVTLYVALAGAMPFGRSSSSAEVLRRIESGRRIALRKLNPRVPRDLETILAKAMEPAPARRYASAAELADDLERLLRFEPVRAKPAGLLLRLQRWMERSPQLALALLALVGTLALGIAIAVSLALDLARRSEDLRTSAANERFLRIEAERQSGIAATQVALQTSLAGFLRSMLQYGNSSYGSGDGERTVRDATLMASRELREFESRYLPNAAFKLHGMLIEFLLPLGLHVEVHEHVERLIALRDELYPEGSAEAAEADYLCGRHLRLLGRWTEAGCLLHRAVAARRALGAEHRIQLAQALVSAGYAHRGLGELDAAQACFGEAIVHYAADLALHYDSVALALGARSSVEVARGDLPAAETSARAAVDLLSAGSRGAPHQDLGIVLFQLGFIRYRRGDTETGYRWMGEALAISEAHAGKSHRQVAGLALRLGALLLEFERREEATAWIERAYERSSALDLAQSVELAEALLEIGAAERAVRVLAPWGELDEATWLHARVAELRAAAMSGR